MAYAAESVTTRSTSYSRYLATDSARRARGDDAEAQDPAGDVVVAGVGHGERRDHAGPSGDAPATSQSSCWRASPLARRKADDQHVDRGEQAEPEHRSPRQLTTAMPMSAMAAIAQGLTRSSYGRSEVRGAHSAAAWKTTRETTVSTG